MNELSSSGPMKLNEWRVTIFVLNLIPHRDQISTFEMENILI